MRSLAGGLASEIYISPWFILSVGMLSLFLAVEKRKAEILTMKNDKVITRKVLKSYSLKVINKFESVLTSCTVITYSLWAYGPLIDGAKSPYMILTIPLVILGIFRYQMLSEKVDNETGFNCNNILETPENIILHDRPIQVIVLLWLSITIYIGLLT